MSIQMIFLGKLMLTVSYIEHLPYLVCVSVTTFSATARNNAPNKIYQRLQRDMSKVLKMAFSLKMLGSEVMASFA